MTVVVGFDIHREQVTFDALDDETGEVMRGRIAPADGPALRRFLASLPAAPRVAVADEAALAVPEIQWSAPPECPAVAPPACSATAPTGRAGSRTPARP